MYFMDLINLIISLTIVSAATGNVTLTVGVGNVNPSAPLPPGGGEFTFDWQGTGPITPILTGIPIDATYSIQGVGLFVPPIIPVPVARQQFIDDLIAYLTTKYWIPAGVTPVIADVQLVLGIIYDSFPNWIELSIFVSNAIFTTSGFNNLSQIEPAPLPGDLWISRGILQITFEYNYAKLATLTGDQSFYNTPQILAALTTLATNGSITFWNDLLQQAYAKNPAFLLTWESALELLNTKEVQPPYEADYALNKANRLAVYEDVLLLFPVVLAKDEANPSRKSEKKSSKKSGKK